MDFSTLIWIVGILVILLVLIPSYLGRLQREPRECGRDYRLCIAMIIKYAYVTVGSLQSLQALRPRFWPPPSLPALFWLLFLRPRDLSGRTDTLANTGDLPSTVTAACRPTTERPSRFNAPDKW